MIVLSKYKYLGKLFFYLILLEQLIIQFGRIIFKNTLWSTFIINLLSLKWLRIQKIYIYNLNMDGKFHASIIHNFLQIQHFNFKIWHFINIIIYGTHRIGFLRLISTPWIKMMKAILFSKRLQDQDHWRF